MPDRYKFTAIKMGIKGKEEIESELEAENLEQAKKRIKKMNLFATSIMLCPPDFEFGQGELPVFYFNGETPAKSSCSGVIEMDDEDKALEHLQNFHIRVTELKPATPEQIENHKEMFMIRKGELHFKENDPQSPEALFKRTIWLECKMAKGDDWLDGKVSLEPQSGNTILRFSKKVDSYYEDCWEGDIKDATVELKGLIGKKLTYSKDGNTATFKGKAAKLSRLLNFCKEKSAE